MGVGYVPQGRDDLPAADGAREPGDRLCLPAASEHMVPDEIYELFPVLKEMRNGAAATCRAGSSSNCHRAGADHQAESCLLLDEPTEGIQPNIIQQIGRVIEYCAIRATMAIVLVEQYFDFAYGLADRFCVLERGEVKIEGDRDSVSKESLREAVSV
jgi:urea transport system ATP-binding protein